VTLSSVPGTALLALGSPERGRVLGAELAGAGYGPVLHAAPADVGEAAVRAGPGDLAVVECGTPSGGCSPAVAALRTAGWRHIVVIGADARPSSVVGALTTGAGAFLVAGDAEPPVRPASAEARPPGTGGRGPRAVVDAAGREQILSLREIQVVELAAEGLGNVEIGREMGLSALTVKSHLARMTRRLGARDRAHLVLLALRSGVLP
jgi:DNA-binding NarL/FixJ family response regulator